MDWSRLLVYGTVAVVLVVTAVSGPAVGLVDLTTPRFDATGLGQGSATIDAVEAPDTARIDRNLQSESYQLEVPDARIHVASIRGRPTVSYKISIAGLNYSRGATHFLDEADTGWVALSVDGATLAPAAVTQSSYSGTLSVVLRYNDTERVVYEEPIALEVTS